MSPTHRVYRITTSGSVQYTPCWCAARYDHYVGRENTLADEDHENGSTS